MMHCVGTRAKRKKGHERSARRALFCCNVTHLKHLRIGVAAVVECFDYLCSVIGRNMVGVEALVDLVDWREAV